MNNSLIGKKILTSSDRPSPPIVLCTISQTRAVLVQIKVGTLKVAAGPNVLVSYLPSGIMFRTKKDLVI